MLSVYIIALLSSVLFAYSLRSFWAGVLAFLIVLSACDVAVYCVKQGQYVGPVRAIHVVLEVVEVVTGEIAAAEKNAIRYEECVSRLENKVWNSNQTVPSHKWIHVYCSQQ